MTIFTEVFPNPVAAGSSINIICHRLDEGYYLLRLEDDAGRSRQRDTLWIDEDAAIIDLELPRLISGTYLLSLVHSDTGKCYSTQLVIASL